MLLLTILTALKLQTVTSRCDTKPPRLHLSVIAKHSFTLIAFLKFVFFLLTAGPKRHIKFTKSSLDISKRILETQLRFSIQSDVIIPQSHQQFITVTYCFLFFDFSLAQKHALSFYFRLIVLPGE